MVGGVAGPFAELVEQSGGEVLERAADSMLASGLAVALSREHRIRRAFQDLAARLLNKLRERSGYAAGHRGSANTHTFHRRRP